MTRDELLRIHNEQLRAHKFINFLSTFAELCGYKFCCRIAIRDIKTDGIYWEWLGIEENK